MDIRNWTLPGVMLVCSFGFAAAAAVLWSLNWCLISNAADRERWNERLFGSVAGFVEEKTPALREWQRAAAQKFQTTLERLVGAAFLNPRSVVASFMLSLVAMLSMVPIGGAWLTIIVGFTCLVGGTVWGYFYLPFVRAPFSNRDLKKQIIENSKSPWLKEIIERPTFSSLVVTYLVLLGAVVVPVMFFIVPFVPGQGREIAIIALSGIILCSAIITGIRSGRVGFIVGLIVSSILVAPILFALIVPLQVSYTAFALCAFVNLFFDLASFSVTRALVRRIAQSHSWAVGLTYWLFDVLAALVIAAITFVTVDAIESAVRIPRIPFFASLDGTPSSVPFALTGFAPTFVHFVFFLVLVAAYFWQGLRRILFTMFFRAYERETSAFAQLAGACAVLAGLCMGLWRLVR